MILVPTRQHTHIFTSREILRANRASQISFLYNSRCITATMHARPLCTPMHSRLHQCCLRDRLQSLITAGTYSSRAFWRVSARSVLQLNIPIFSWLRRFWITEFNNWESFQHGPRQTLGSTLSWSSQIACSRSVSFWMSMSSDSASGDNNQEKQGYDTSDTV